MPHDRVYEFLRSNRFFAQTADGLEEMAAAELERLGATDAKPAFRGVYFSADLDCLYRVNYAAALLTRVLAPLVTFDCHSAKYLYRRAHDIPWPDLFSIDDTFAVFAMAMGAVLFVQLLAVLQVVARSGAVFRVHRQLGRVGARVGHLLQR